MWILVPMMALAIPLTAVIGKVVVKPIVDAISRLPALGTSTPQVGTAAGELADVGERLAELERTLARIQEEQDFQRKLLSARAEEAGAQDAP